MKKNICFTIFFLAFGTITSAQTKVYRINPVHNFLQGEKMTSMNGKYELTFQPNGNLVLRMLTMGLPDFEGNPQIQEKIIWSSKTANKANSCTLQQDGNLVLYDNAKKAVWATNTNGRGAYITIQDDGNVVIYDKAKKAVWATNTNEK
jgi:hypothetical protein